MAVDHNFNFTSPITHRRATFYNAVSTACGSRVSFQPAVIDHGDICAITAHVHRDVALSNRTSRDMTRLSPIAILMNGQNGDNKVLHTQGTAQSFWSVQQSALYSNTE